MSKRILYCLPVLAVLVLAGCGRSVPQALGTLEYDRITLPAPAAERIVAVMVHPGDRVKAGQELLQLDPSHARAELAAAKAQVEQQREALAALKVGPREESIHQARAKLASAKADAQDAQASYQRLLPLKHKQYVSAARLDSAKAAAKAAQGRVNAARAALAELQHGTRPEKIAQGKAALATAKAKVRAQRVLLNKLHVTAPRAGVVDAIPYKRGDQAPVGAPLAILLVGQAPYARIYVPEPLRAHVHVGDHVKVRVDGYDKTYAGRVRMVRDEPEFTPYYALTGANAARLSYIAEVALGKKASKLPAGLPVHVTLPGAEQ